MLRRELDRAAHAATLATRREQHAVEELRQAQAQAQAQQVQAQAQAQAAATAAQDMSEVAAEVAASQAELRAARATIQAHEASLGHALSREEGLRREVAVARREAEEELEAARRVAVEELETARALHAADARGRGDEGRARETVLQEQLAEAVAVARAARAHEERMSMEAMEESARGTASMREQLLSAVHKEVAARGAAQEMGELVRDLQGKLREGADAKRATESEAAAARQEAMHVERRAVDEARQAATAHATAVAGLQAKGIVALPSPQR